jgi:uncharacterized damage-inducible protein DinB
MSIAQSLLPEFDQEMATTRRCLERVPEDRLSYQPDPKSMTLARLAGHVAESPIWGTLAMGSDSFDFASGAYQPMEMTSRDQVLQAFDERVTAARAAIAAASDAELMKDWAMKSGEAVLMSMPKLGVIRMVLLNHTIHHRGQLSVYLRSTGAKVPSIYGPSADEGQMPGA